MQRYKSIFKESGGSSKVRNENEAKQIVDISDLVWGETLEKMNWVRAYSTSPTGWRLPTVQELYTAYVKKVKGFQDKIYWSSSIYVPIPEAAWCVFFYDGYVSTDKKRDYTYSVRYVKNL